MLDYRELLQWVLQTKDSVYSIIKTTAPSCKGARHSISAHTEV